MTEEERNHEEIMRDLLLSYLTFGILLIWDEKKL